MSINEANGEIVRGFYAASAARDEAGMHACFAEDAVWRLPGKSLISGEHRGWSSIRDDFLTRLGPLSGGTFRADLLDVAVGEEYVVAVLHATGNDGGRVLDVTGCQLMRVRDGKIAEVQGHYSDQYEFDAFWKETESN